MKQVDRETINQIKEWFSLDKYRPVAELRPAELAGQIAKRAIIRNAMNTQDEALRDSYKPYLEIAIPELMGTPLSPFEFGYQNRPNVVEAQSYCTPTVLPLSFKDIDRLRQLRSDLPTGKDEFVDTWSTENPDLGLLPFGHVIIDTNARDEDIIKDFKQWLTNFRKEANQTPLKPHPRNQSGLFTHWHLIELFPYFDLNAWAHHHQATLKREMLIELLYPNLDVDPSRLRKLELEDKVPEVITLKNAIALLNSAK